MDDDTDDKDDSKRKSRNLSEKKRRDQFNLLVNELSSMVSASSRKMDKSTVLKSTIAFLKHHNEVTVRSRVHEIQEDWKPSFLSNEEFTHLILEALDGFIMVFSATGKIFYASESITSLLGHLPSDLLNMTIYDLAYEENHSELYNILLNPVAVIDPLQNGLSVDNQNTFTCHLKRGGLDFREEVSYDLVQFTGYFRSDVDLENMLPNTRTSCFPGDTDSRLLFVGTGRIQTPQLIREMTIVDSSKSEFTSRHSLEWKFLFLDHRAPPIIGYLPFEVLGTSGYDYYHFDDLERVIQCHEALMQKGEGTSSYYRFLTKGQQWIWIQTRFYITYHQWNSKPEFVVCTHRVVSYVDVMKQLRNNSGGNNLNSNITVVKDIDDGDSVIDDKQIQTSNSMILSTSWGSKSTRTQHRFNVTPDSPSVKSSRTRLPIYHDNGSDSGDSPASRHSQQTVTQFGTRSRLRHNAANHAQHHQKLMAQQHQQIAAQQLHHPPPQTHIIPQQIHHHQTRSIGNTQIIGATFVEPQQYLAAIPVQPVITSPFSGTAAVISPIRHTAEILPPGVVMTSHQSHIQDQLQRKHVELQQLIVQQQEELRRVSDQLLMARYGLLPSIVNVPIAFNSSNNSNQNINSNSSDHIAPNQHSIHHSQLQHHHQLQHQPNQHQHLYQHQQHQHQHHHNHSVLSNLDHSGPQPLEPVDQKTIDTGMISTGSQNDDMISYMQLTPVPISHLHNMRIQTDSSQDSQVHPHSNQSQSQQISIPNELEVLPYQMSQEQSQILFNSSNSPRPN